MDETIESRVAIHEKEGHEHNDGLAEDDPNFLLGGQYKEPLRILSCFDLHCGDRSYSFLQNSIHSEEQRGEEDAVALMFL